jgi:hypothetical protein
MFVVLAVTAAGASGIYLGKMSVEGASMPLSIPALVFGVLGLVMAWGAIAAR